MAYNDDRMVFDETTNRYYITEQALIEHGVDVRARFTAQGLSDGGAHAVNALISDATDLVYNYAHDGVYDTAVQDYILANEEKVRPGLFRALLAMAVSLARYGNRMDSVEAEERAVAIPSQVRAEFDIVYPCLGHTLKYSGRWRR